MSTEDNKALVRRYQEAHNSNNLAALDDIVAPNLISHSGIPGLPGGLEGGKMVHMMFMSAFPDGHVTIEDLVAEGDKVVERFTFSGTNQGSFMGAPPTGKHITASGMSIFRIADGKIVEHWGENDTMGVMQQLGFIPAPAHTCCSQAHESHGPDYNMYVPVFSVKELQGVIAIVDVVDATIIANSHPEEAAKTRRKARSNRFIQQHSGDLGTTGGCFNVAI